MRDIPENWWANLRAVEISGGEPLYQEDAVEFLEFLSDVNPKLHLRIITNLTIFNEKIKHNGAKSLREPYRRQEKWDSLSDFAPLCIIFSLKSYEGWEQ